MENEVRTARQQMLDEVICGMRRQPKSLSSKYFYDQRGSKLFDRITRLKEYYPTRTERAIIKNNIDEIAGYIGRNAVLVELGSGSSKKTRLLLNHLSEIAAYVPVEISQKYLSSVVQSLKKEYPGLPIKPVCADYTQPFQIPPIPNPHTYYLLFYPGSTIGNFHPEAAKKFLGTVSNILNPGGGMLIGVDLKKDPAILEAAYNDEKGVTAEFNKNILHHINRKLDAGFNTQNFQHKAFYNQNEGRIEMHLVAEASQQVAIGGEQFKVAEGEKIHTENSYKYSLPEFEELVGDWFSVKKVWTDLNNYFSVQYLQRR